MKKILVVEDDKRIGKVICDFLNSEGFDTQHVETGGDALLTFDDEEFSLIILDVMIPELDGFTVARTIRKKSDIPIIIVSARTGDEDQLMGYELNIDDYVTKPFNPDILVAKVKNLLKRIESYRGNGSSELWEMEDFKVNFSSRKVSVDGENIDLEPKQFDILGYLIQNKNKAVSRDELLDKVWGREYFGNDRVVDTQIKKLRRKLKHKAYFIKTVFSIGYSFEVKE